MILATHGIVGSSIVQFDADAQAFFNRVTTAGGTLSATVQQAVNQLVLDMKADGIWTKMKAIYPMVGASAAACAQNLKSSSFTGTFNGGWTFSSTGATPNGTNAYMNTGLIESSNLSDTSKHLSFYSRTQDSSKNAHDIGAEGTTAGTNFDLFLYYAAVTNKGYIDGGYPTNAVQSNDTNTLGFQIGTRTANNVQKLFWNNSLLATNTTTKTVAQTSNNIYLGSTNNGTATAFSNKECAFASIGDGLTDTEASDFYTAVQAFQTTLSRNV